MTTPLAATVRILNQPLVKEGIKKASGAITFAFGILEAYQLCVERKPIEPPSWQRTICKVVETAARISIILSASVTQPGVYLVGTLVGLVFTPVQLESLIGPNTIFVINPYHPRHVVSIAAAVLAVPGVLLTLYDAIVWTRKNVTHLEARIKVSVCFNFLTSRAILHQANVFFTGRFS